MTPQPRATVTVAYWSDANELSRSTAPLAALGRSIIGALAHLLPVLAVGADEPTTAIHL